MPRKKWQALDSEHGFLTDKPPDFNNLHTLGYRTNRNHEISIYNSHNTANIQIYQIQVYNKSLFFCSNIVYEP